VTHVVLLAVHLAIQLVIGAFYRVLAHKTHTLSQLKVSFTNWFVLKEQIGSSKRLITNMTLHASWMIISIIVDDTVSNNLLFTNTTLLLCGLKTLGTISIFILGEEFSI